MVWKLMMRLSPSPIVISQPFPAASFPVVELRKLVEPAALLTESLSQAGGDDGGGFGVKLADLVAAVVVLRVSQIGNAALGLTPRRVDHRTRFNRPRPPVHPVHKIVPRRRGEVSPATQIQPNPRPKVHDPPTRFTLRHKTGWTGHRWEKRRRGRRVGGSE